MGRPRFARPKHIKPSAGAEAAARRVIALLNGEPILAQPPEPAWNIRPGEKKYHIRNLNYDCTETDLRELFAPLGHIVELHLFIDNFTGRSRGFACLRLVGPDALALNGTTLQGRELKIKSWDAPQ
jgi:hypothetical protein